MNFSEWFKNFIKYCYENGKNLDGIQGDNTGEFTEKILNSLSDKLDKVSNELLTSVTHMPHLSDLPEMMPVYNYIKYISLSLTGCIVGYKGLKLLFSNDEIDRMQSKKVFSRLGYSFMLSGLSLKFIDLLITANNCISNLVLSNFEIGSLTFTTSTTGIVIPVVIFTIQAISILKILIGFWMRMAELVFAGIISPAMFTCWINNEWAGYLKNWMKRVSTLVFTQVTLVLILVIYTMMLKGWCLSNTINGACLSMATLLLLDKGPKILQGFADNSSYQDAKNTVNKVIHSRSMRTVTKSFSKKQGGNKIG